VSEENCLNIDSIKISVECYKNLFEFNYNKIQKNLEFIILQKIMNFENF
jgi:hypothetical protein